jgi:hypothetical protein
LEKKGEDAFLGTQMEFVEEGRGGGFNQMIQQLAGRVTHFLQKGRNIAKGSTVPIRRGTGTVEQTKTTEFVVQPFQGLGRIFHGGVWCFSGLVGKGRVLFCLVMAQQGEFSESVFKRLSLAPF